ncbi:PASTA domain-containing protein [Actinosynnema sp. NPDC004786]
MAERTNVGVGDSEAGPGTDEPRDDRRQRRGRWWRRCRPELKVEGTADGIGVAGVGVAGLVVALAGAALWWFVIHDAKVSVPNLTGMSQVGAELRLKEDDLVVRQTLTEPSALAPGSVVRTDPPAGTKLAKGDGVVLYLAGPATGDPSRPTTAPPQPTHLVPPPPTVGGQRPTVAPTLPTREPDPGPSSTRQPDPEVSDALPESHATHVERDLVIGRYNWVDLDTGAYSPANGGDLYFGQDANTGAFHLQPMSSGGADEVGTAARAYATCAGASPTTDQIPLDTLPVGTVICVRTDEDRLSAVGITGASEGPNGRDLHVSYTTWER